VGTYFDSSDQSIAAHAILPLLVRSGPCLKSKIWYFDVYTWMILNHLSLSSNKDLLALPKMKREFE